MFTIDGHLDLAANALHLRRDLTRPVAEIRQAEQQRGPGPFGTSVVSLPELRRANVGAVFATVMVRLEAGGRHESFVMSTQDQCFALGRGHAAYYEALEALGEVRLIKTKTDLDTTVQAWQSPGEREPIGVVLAMESADPIMSLDQVPLWHEIGLRSVSLSHYGTSRYAHGTGTDGGLRDGGRELLAALRAANIAVDVTHLTDIGFWEVLDAFDGTILASHHNCRALVPGQRQLTDDMIHGLIDRDAVIGTSFDLWMLDPSFNRANVRRSMGLDAVADQIDHVCQLAGNARHAAIGSDLDGGFGLEQTPLGLESIADLPALFAALERRGYAHEDLERIASGNWLRLIRRVLPS